MDSPSPSTPTDLGRWLSELPRDRARLVYLSAVPLWLDRGLLITLHGTHDLARLALQILEEHMLVTSVSRRRIVIRPEARRHLLQAGWNGELPDYIDVNYRLANYCLEQVALTSDSSKQFRWARAAFYHQIASQQTIGWQQLAQIYEDAEKRGLSGAALQVLEPLRELQPLLSTDDRATLVYYRARAALLDGQIRKAECLFRAVIARGRPITLVGVAHRGLGQVLAARQHWSEALKQFRLSEAFLRQNSSRDTLSLALTQLGIGDMHQEMAEFSGGIIRVAYPPPGGRWTNWARTLLQLPIYLYNWAGHAIQRLPFIDVGFRYQNWISARLMLAAEAAYRRAILLMDSNPSPQALYEARLGLARVYTKLGMQRRAENILNVLAQWDYVIKSEYRQAQLNFRRAELAEAQQKNNLAEELLQQVIRVFITYQQKHGLAVAYQRLGNLMTYRGDMQMALTTYGKALELFGQTGQSLYQTAVLNEISRISVETVEEEDRREYLTPFPDHLASLYRRLTYLGAGFLVFLATLLTFISLIIIFRTESAVLQGLVSLTIIGLILGWPLIPVWLIQIFYLGSGLLISFLLPIGTLERDPPLRIAVDKERLTFRGGKSQEESYLPWNSIVRLQTVNYELRSHPISLFSYLDVLGQERRWQIPAFTTDYVNLYQDLTKRITPSKLQIFSFELITHPLNYLTALLLLPIGIAFQKSFELGIPISDDPTQFTPTFISGALLGAFIAGLLLFPLITFWRLIIHQWQLWRNTPAGHPRPRPNMIVHLFAVFWTFLTYLYLNYIYALFQL